MNKVHRTPFFLPGKLTTPTDQTHLISTLSSHDTSSTKLYTLLLTTLPIVPALFHIPLLASISSFLPTLLAIASFLASAYALYFLPLPPVKVGIISTEELKSGSAGGRKRVGERGYGLNTFTTSTSSSRDGDAAQERRPVPWVSDDVAEVLAKYIVPANGAVCVVLAILELWQGRSWSEGIGVGGGFLPGFVLSVVMWARRELRVVDLGELEKLKYRSKGM